MDVYKIDDIGELLKNNAYAGRGIVIGKTPDGKNAVTAYFIMGRSENSRNRIFKEEGENVTIYPFDESKVEDPSLIIYSPIKKIENKLIVTNGDQTDTIYDFIKKGECFREALKTREFEPDKPNYTPRISGIMNFKDNDFDYSMSILKSLDKDGSACGRYFYDYEAVNGLGHFIHTYVCDGNPLPTFTGEPERVAIENDIDAFADKIWTNLNESNKISLYVRYINIADGTVENRMFNKNA
ncbi:IMP cyclohydrolase [Anaerotignum sp. MSJ-24]|uniref:IMP cyclohydrolase n=1 Tax=Anaerotignum sp. MSJ-24 TaxID=2841521 RepID=UPI001C125B6E|nr:IMP cyclohydrolase [Anaerotignum sp. MSJ-24]MBU5463139.1 IMP cyclohydrolase [Anaerotignum sp. MSJ-24]